MHHCAVKFPDVAGTVIHLLMDFLSNSSAASALDVIVFVREILETNPKLHDTVLERLFDNFSQIQSLRVCSCALWIFGEYVCVCVCVCVVYMCLVYVCFGRDDGVWV